MTDEELVAVLRWRGSALQEGAFFAAADRIEQYEEAYQYALHLAKALRENYPPNPDFRFLGDLVGLLTQIDNMVAGLSLTTDRDAAYAQGYADAETEISKSALGQRNAFLHSQYADAVDHIKVLTAERDHAWAMAAKADTQMGQALADNLQAKADATRLRALLAEADRRIVWEAHGFGSDFAERVEAALKGESHE